MKYSTLLKKRIIENVKREFNNDKIIERKSAIIFKDIRYNFLSDTYGNIHKNQSWKIRTLKRHAQFNDGTLEMQSSNSSDALLMNVFCHKKFTGWIEPKKLLKINSNYEFEFGWNPCFENEDARYPTEIDLKIGKRIFESKLTEVSFTSKEAKVVESYKDFKTVFYPELLQENSKRYKSYQLIRNILTAYKYGFEFSILIDQSRIDLIKELLTVVEAIRDSGLRKKISFFTWQEIAEVCGAELKQYLEKRYF